MQNTAREVRMNSEVMFSRGPFYTDMLVLDNQLEVIYNSSVRTQNVV